ncbi:class A beta-lactamase [Modicisalibacter radicis]|uniref:class A beta-lactamase n=1 Tax=Halomonas sp. EAR18 TaxID=2518972 RepID=UPI001FCE8AC0|nr:class A beta-lactamase [Halomonas sp. EAR18]
MTLRRSGTWIGTLLAGLTMATTLMAATPQGPDTDFGERLADLESRLDARIGVAVLDTQTGLRWGYRADERFPMSSTFKVLACGAVLARVDAGKESLDRRLRFEAGDLVTYSPVTEHRTGGEGMTLAELCEATITTSDNTAGNLILGTLGGPAGLTDFMRTLGDDATRLDRWETALNEATPGDPRDTTTPRAMTDSLHALLLGDRLSPSSRERLIDWLVANQTGDAKLRAGLPEGWRIGDKTGGGGHGTNNDVAIIWPPGRQPAIVSVYLTGSQADFEARNAAIADVARALTPMLAR